MPIVRRHENLQYNQHPKRDSNVASTNVTGWTSLLVSERQCSLLCSWRHRTSDRSFFIISPSAERLMVRKTILLGILVSQNEVAVLNSLAYSRLFTTGNYDLVADLRLVLTEAKTGETKNALSKLFTLFMLITWKIWDCVRTSNV